MEKTVNARRRRTWWAVGATVALVAVAGCDQEITNKDPSPSPSFTAGAPEGVTVPADAGGGAGWVSGSENELWVYTVGSSTNPFVATKATADGQTVSVTLNEAYPREPASADLSPTTSYITVPDSVDRDAPVTVELGDLGTAEIRDEDNPGWLLLNN